ncbi:hypothetical protein ACT4UT_28085 [Bacillus sp. B-TM1]
MERRVAARDVNNPEDKTPEITVQEAIKNVCAISRNCSYIYFCSSWKSFTIIIIQKINPYTTIWF